MNGHKFPRKFALLSKNDNWSYLEVEGGWFIHHYTHHLRGNECVAISECGFFYPDPAGKWAAMLEAE